MDHGTVRVAVLSDTHGMLRREVVAAKGSDGFYKMLCLGGRVFGGEEVVIGSAPDLMLEGVLPGQGEVFIDHSLALGGFNIDAFQAGDFCGLFYVADGAAAFVRHHKK